MPITLNDEDLDKAFAHLGWLCRLMKREGTKSGTGYELKDATRAYGEFVFILAARLGRTEEQERAREIVAALDV